MLYVKPSSGACQRLSGSYDLQISNLNTNVNKLLSRYQLISADIYSAVCPEIAKGTEKVISITIKRHVNNTMLIPTIRSTGYLNIREMEWGPEAPGDRVLKLTFLNPTTIPHSCTARIFVLEFITG